MESNWSKGKLGDIAEITMGQSPKGVDCNEIQDGDPLLNGPTEFSGWHPYPTQYTTDPKRFAKEGDLLFCVRGSTTGRMNWAEQEYAIGRGIASFRHKLGKEYQAYLRALVEYKLPILLQSATGSTFPNVSKNQLFDLEIDIPSAQDALSISKVISSLDNKIYLNKQTNQTLEKMAQTLFKSWFVDFDPVFDNALAKADFNLENLPSAWPEALLQRATLRLQVLQHNPALQAKLTQHNLAETQANTAPEQTSPTENTHQHFPSEFELTDEPSIGINGWIPKGWENIAFNEMVKTVSETYPLKTANKVVFLNTGDILEGKFLHKNYSEPMSLPGQAKKSIKKGDILYSEIRPKNKRFALVNFDGNEHVVSTKLMVLRPNEGFDELFPYFVLTQDKNITILQKAAESRSGTFPQITYTELAMIKVSLPRDRKLMNIFIVQYLKDHFAQKDQRDFQNETLTKLRDTLLPKLISGELKIPDLETIDA